MAIIRFCLVVVSLLFITTSTGLAQSPGPERFAKIEQAWRVWSAKNNVSRSQIAVGYRGKIVHAKSLNIAIDEPMTLASLSKAITGACILKLEEQGIITRETTIGDLRKAGFVDTFPGGTAANITVSKLLTHTSGLKPDITQGRVHRWFNLPSNQLQKISKEALQPQNRRGKRNDYFYNNGNYAVLGAMIEAKTGKTYEEVCTKALEDVGRFKNIRPSKLLLSISAFGGWEASAGSFLKFANAAFGGDTIMQRAPTALPYTKIGSKIYYGPGVVFRKNRTRGTNVWHFGLLCFPERENDGGSYFAVIGSDWSVAVTHNVCLKDNAAFELDQTLIQGIFGKL